MASDTELTLGEGFYERTFEGSMVSDRMRPVADKPLTSMAVILGDGSRVDLKIENGMLYLNSPDGTLIVRPAVSNAIHVEVETHYARAVRNRNGNA